MNERNKKKPTKISSILSNFDAKNDVQRNNLFNKFYG